VYGDQGQFRHVAGTEFLERCLRMVAGPISSMLKPSASSVSSDVGYPIPSHSYHHSGSKAELFTIRE
jgi:hypothetical protein